MRKSLYLVLMVVGLALSFIAGYLVHTGGGESQNQRSLSRADYGSPAESENLSEDGDPPPGTVRMSLEKQQKMGVSLAAVERGRGEWRIRVPGRVVPDETRIYRVVTAVDCWITSVHGNTTGAIVKKDEVLASFYSPEFLSAQQAYLYALGALRRFKSNKKETADQVNLTELNVQQYKDTLRNLGMSEIQIEEIGRTRRYTENVEVRAPVSGFVTVRNVSPGLRVDKGSEIYRIVDLHHVWVLADAFEKDAKYLKPGMAVKVTYPPLKKIFQARVSEVLPLFDPVTRTLKVRLEMPNPGFVLKPDMFVDVEFPVSVEQAVLVPNDAVLDSGTRQTVFIDLGKGCFEPREVETGRRFGNRVEITKGLKPGERIVVSGNFLIDSESRTELALNGIKEDLTRDPVSGRKLSVHKAEKAGLKIAHRDRVYYFTTEENRKKFEREPDRYLSRLGE